MIGADERARIRAHLRGYTDPELLVAVSILTGHRDSAPTPEAAEYHADWLNLALDIRDERNALAREVDSATNPFKVISDLNGGGPTS